MLRGGAILKIFQLIQKTTMVAFTNKIFTIENIRFLMGLGSGNVKYLGVFFDSK